MVCFLKRRVPPRRGVLSNDPGCAAGSGQRGTLTRPNYQTNPFSPPECASARHPQPATDDQGRERGGLWRRQCTATPSGDHGGSSDQPRGVKLARAGGPGVIGTGRQGRRRVQTSPHRMPPNRSAARQVRSWSRWSRAYEAGGWPRDPGSRAAYGQTKRQGIQLDFATRPFGEKPVNAAIPLKSACYWLYLAGWVLGNLQPPLPNPPPPGGRALG